MAHVTNYLENGVDLGNILVDKSYLIDVYPQLVDWSRTSSLWSMYYINDLNHHVGGYNWKQASFNGSTTVAVKSDGTLWTWGGNYIGQMGDGTVVEKLSPVQTIAGGTNWKEVYINDAYYATAGAIKTDGTLWMWGSGDVGRLGDGTLVAKSSPVQTIAGGTNWKQISVGVSVGAIKTDGTLWMWGQNSSGQLGDGTEVDKSSPVQTVAGGTNWKQVSTSASAYFTSAIKTDGTLWSWGMNNSGQLGDGTRTVRSSPVQTVAGGTNWKQVAVGSAATAAIKTDGTLWMWGENFYSQLGDGTRVNKSSPVQTIAGGTNWKQVSTGNQVTSAIKTDGTLWVWGGQEIRPDFEMIRKPGTNWRSTYAQGYVISLREEFDYNPVLTGSVPWLLTKNVNIPNFNDILKISTFYSTSAYIKTDNTLWLWGSNYSGQLGDGTLDSKSSPVQTVAGGSNWKQVSLGSSGTTAIKTDGTLWSWGMNTYGELGDGTTDNVVSPVQTVAGGTNWKEVSRGPWHSAAIKTDGTLWVWGGNYSGELGDGTTVNKSSPVQTIAGGTNWKQVSTGYYNTAAIKTDNTLWIWGSNVYGELGDGTTVAKSSPVQTIAGGTNWGKVDIVFENCAAIKLDGTLWTWGKNGVGQLGDGTTVAKSSPVQTIAGGSNWENLYLGDKHCVASKTDGSLWAWGNNQTGEFLDLSINTALYSSPVQIFAGSKPSDILLVTSNKADLSSGGGLVMIKNIDKYE